MQMLKLVVLHNLLTQGVEKNLICRSTPIKNCFLEVLPFSCTFFRTAALLWAAGTSDIATASLRAALAAADTEEHDEEEGPNDDEQHCQPV